MTFSSPRGGFLRAVLLVSAVCPSALHGQTLVGFGAGGVYAGDVSEAPNSVWVATAGYWATSPFGFEVEVSSYPGFFPDSHPDPDRHVTGDLLTAAAHVIVGAPVGGRKGFGVRPFVSGGVVLFSLRAEEPTGMFDVQRSDVGFDVGAGVIVFASDHLGIRTDVRYYRDDREEVRTDVPHPTCCRPIGFTTFGFRRATLSLSTRF